MWWDIIKDEAEVDEAVEDITSLKTIYGMDPLQVTTNWIRGPLSALNQFADLFNKGKNNNLFKPNTYLEYKGYEWTEEERWDGTRAFMNNKSKFKDKTSVQPKRGDLIDLVKYSIRSKDSNWQIKIFINYDFDKSIFPDMNIKIYENDKHVATMGYYGLTSKLYFSNWFKELENLNFRYKNITLLHSYKNKPITLTGGNALSNIINIIRNEFNRLKKYRVKISLYKIRNSIQKRAREGKGSPIPSNIANLFNYGKFEAWFERILLPIMRMTNMKEFNQMSKIHEYRAVVFR